jgi:hypothetical protein
MVRKKKKKEVRGRRKPNEDRRQDGSLYDPRHPCHPPFTLSITTRTYIVGFVIHVDMWIQGINGLVDRGVLLLLRLL